MEDHTLPVTVVVPGDLHLTRPDLENHRVGQWVIDQVNEWIRPDFVQFIGDNVQDATAEQFRLFRGLTDGLRVPWFALVGDHDRHDDPDKLGHRTHVGHPYGSHVFRGFRFVRLDTQEAKPAGLSPGQVDWFRAEVAAAIGAGERVVVFQHNYPYQIWEDYTGPGIEAWREIVQTRRIHTIVCGHTHYWQVANDGRNAVVAVRSIGDPEGGPPGFLLAHFRGDEFAMTYRSIADAGPLVLVTHPRSRMLATGPAHVVRGRVRIGTRVWSTRPLVVVEARIDDGPWVRLDWLVRDEWGGDVAGGEWTKGTHTVAAQARDISGEVGQQTIEFAVDPTGRYTAVPGVWPPVDRTNFC
ncbi:metallophosphoesterase family protein [Fimbriiglobus ruber]|uniref:Serine/threonine protein kinase related protein n=1 Tax=Fimbriiglobus ruber TaxID=1908690 RepID=A0A225D3R7_9BACT|nr:metallophosphoesterase [Fimbriiglobus ruber]OWK35603.1 serine/threonine protein kinase related protein [Fimbriiglobus ruber]